MAAYPLGQCLYCGAVLDEKTKHEHIIPSGLGGSLKTRKVICSPCNERLGKVIDEPMSLRFRPIMNYLEPALRDSVKAPEMLLESSGKKTLFTGGFKPRLTKSTIEVRNSRGRPVKWKSPDEEAAKKLAETIGISGAVHTKRTFEELENDYVQETAIYHPILVCACARIAFEYADLVSQTASSDFARGQFRQPAFDTIATLINRFDEVIGPLMRNQVPPDKVPRFLSFDKAYCFPRFKYDMDCIFTDNNCPHDSPFRHRIIVCGNGQRREVMGIVDYFQGDIWGCLLSDSYKGADFSYLYHRSIIRDTEPDWSSQLDHSVVSYSELDAVRPPARTFTGHPCSTRYEEIYARAIEFIECEHPKVFEEELRFFIAEEKTGPLSLKNTIFSRLEKRLQELFGRNEAWDTEWPQIRSDALNRFEDQFHLSKRDQILNSSLKLYGELFKRCKQHIGPVIPWKILGYPPIHKS